MLSASTTRSLNFYRINQVFDGFKGGVKGVPVHLSKTLFLNPLEPTLSYKFSVDFNHVILVFSPFHDHHSALKKAYLHVLTVLKGEAKPGFNLDGEAVFLRTLYRAFRLSARFC